MKDETRSELTAFANDLWLCRKFGEHSEKDIIIDNAVQTAWMNLDMRYRTYAEDSWTEEVLYWVRRSISRNCVCDDCMKWHIREVQIISEVHYQVDCAFRKQQEKENPCGYLY